MVYPRLLTTRVRLRQVFLDIDDVDMTLLRKLEDLESTLPVRVSITYKALKCHRPWYYCVHERLLSPVARLLFVVGARHPPH